MEIKWLVYFVTIVFVTQDADVAYENLLGMILN
jgi:hypothetical protein